WSSSVAFQRKRQAVIGVKAPFPGFIEPALATSSDKVPSLHHATRTEGLALNEPDVDPAQAPAADARYAHRRAVRRPRLGFRGQVRWLPDDRGNPAGQGFALQPKRQDHQPQLYRSRQSAGGREG